MDAGTVFLLLLLLACPAMMLFMHRGGHSHGDHAGTAHGGHDHRTRHGDDVDELRRRRDELDAEIEERERSSEPLLR